MLEVIRNLAIAPQRQPEKQSSVVARILRAGYVCEIIRDALTCPPIYHWLVQDSESDEILVLGQATGLEEAENTSIAFLDNLRERRLA